MSKNFKFTQLNNFQHGRKLSRLAGYLTRVKNFNSSGITLVEIIVVISIIAMFSAIMIADFPKIEREFALSRSAHQLAQDFRKTEDLGLSGVKISDISGQTIQTKGYGIYIDLRSPPTQQYIIYADVDGDQRYSAGSDIYCSLEQAIVQDCIIDVIDISKSNKNLFIKEIHNIRGVLWTSVDFIPPDPATVIDNLCQANCDDNFPGIEITLSLLNDTSLKRAIRINTSGLIEVK